MSANRFSVGLLVGLLLAVAAGLALEAKRKKPEPPPPHPPDVVYALDSAALHTYGEQVRKATGDSLRALLASQAARARKRHPNLPQAPVLPVQDSARDTTSEAARFEADLQTVMISDTTCQVRVDSFARIDTIQKYQIRSQKQEIKAERRRSNLLAVGLVVVMTLGTVLNFAN